MNAREKVLNKIKKKVSSNRRSQIKQAKKLGHLGLILEFIEAMESVLKNECKNTLDFNSGLERESKVFHKKIQFIDKGAQVKIAWVNEGDVIDWQDLQVDGVHIIWSDAFIENNPDFDKEAFIDLGSLLLEGFFDE